MNKMKLMKKSEDIYPMIEHKTSLWIFNIQSWLICKDNANQCNTLKRKNEKKIELMPQRRTRTIFSLIKIRLRKWIQLVLANFLDNYSLY